MLRKKKDNSEYEIDRELTWKFAIEKNAEYQDRIAELEEENKKLNIIIENTKIEQKSDREHIEELEEENKKLKSDLSECECSMHFENDEVWYRKREYKRLKKWIKDHCNWYWNLFPEDEMKRQWKKADKKRK